MQNALMLHHVVSFHFTMMTNSLYGGPDSLEMHIQNDSSANREKWNVMAFELLSSVPVFMFFHYYYSPYQCITMMMILDVIKLSLAERQLVC